MTKRTAEKQMEDFDSGITDADAAPTDGECHGENIDRDDPMSKDFVGLSGDGAPFVAAWRSSERSSNSETLCDCVVITTCQRN